MEAAVIGIKNELLGNKLIAFVSPKDKTTDANMILSQCARLLPKYKMPAQIQILKNLPKNANGKIDKTSLSIS